jgi:hypothetical protein
VDGNLLLELTKTSALKQITAFHHAVYCGKTIVQVQTLFFLNTHTAAVKKLESRNA